MSTRRLIVRGLPVLFLVAVIAGLLVWIIGGNDSNKSQASNRITRTNTQTPTPVRAKSDVGGVVPVSSPDDSGQLQEQWSWEPSTYGSYWEYVVTVSLAKSASQSLQGTIVNCAPVGLVPVASSTLFEAQDCDLSYGGGLTAGTSQVFEFLPATPTPNPRTAPADPRYLYQHDVPAGASAAQAIARLEPQPASTTSHP